DESGELEAELTLRHIADTLADDAQALAHLLEADEEPVVIVPDLADGDIEFHAVVNFVRIGLTQIPWDAAASKGGAAGRSSDGQVRWQDTDVLGARHNDLVRSHQLLKVIDAMWHLFQERLQCRHELRGKVVVDAADAHVGERDARPGYHFHEVENALPLAEG